MIFYFHQSIKDQNKDVASGEVKNFYDCVSRGYSSTNTYPRQCNLPDGTIFFEDLLPTGQTSTTTASSTNAVTYKDLVKVTNLQPNQVIKSPFILKGEARGNWYFEASFPFQVLDNQGNILSEGQAKAEADWMTTNYVPFTINIIFNAGTATSGKILLKKDNPSGDPIHDDSLSIPVRFEK